MRTGSGNLRATRGFPRAANAVAWRALVALASVPRFVGTASAQVVHFPADKSGTVYSLLGTSFSAGDHYESAFGVGFGTATKGILGFGASFATVPDGDETLFGASAEVHPLGRLSPVGPFVLVGIAGTQAQGGAFALGGGVSASHGFEDGPRIFLQGSAAAAMSFEDVAESGFLGALEIGLQIPIGQRLGLALVPGVAFSEDAEPAWSGALGLAVLARPDDRSKPRDSPW